MKRIIDVTTVILLAAAFILAYYTGFVSTTATGEPVLATNTLALISILGVGVLFGVGGAATAYDRIKRNMVTKSFLGLFIVQILSVIGMAAIMLFVMLEMFDVGSTTIRVLYIVFAMVSVVGYVDAMLYSDSMAEYDGIADEDEDDEEELDDIEDEDDADDQDDDADDDDADDDSDDE